VSDAVEKETGSSTEDVPPKRSIIKWFAIGIGSLVMLVIILLLIIYFTLRSGTLTQSAVPEIKPYLEPFGIELNKIGSLRFDLLKSIELHDLDLNWQDPEVGDAGLVIGQFNFEYSLSDFFSQRAEINQMHLQDVQITANIRQSETSSSKSTEKDEEKPLDLNAIADLLKNPPILLNAQDITLSNIQFDISLEQPDSKLEYRGKLNETNIALLWEPQTLTGSIKMALGQQATENQLKVTSHIDDKNINLITSPAMDVFINWRLENNNDQWQLSQTRLDLKAQTENFQFIEGEQGNQKQAVMLDKIDLQLNNKLASAENRGTGQGLENLFPIKVDSQISSNMVNLAITDLKQDDLSLTAQANHQLNIVLDGQANPFSQQIPSLKFTLDEVLSLDGLDLAVSDQIIKTNKLNWQLNTVGETLNDENNKPNLDILLNAALKTDPISFNKPEGGEGEPGLDVSLKPEFNLTTTAKLISFDNPVDNLIAQLKPEVVIKNISAKIKEAKQVKSYELSETRLNLNADYDKKQIKAVSTIELDKVIIPEVKKSFNLKNETIVETNLDFNQANLDTNVLLDNYPLLIAQLDLDNNPKNFALKHDVKIELSPNLSEYHDAAKELAIIGEPHLSLKGQSKIQHDAVDIQSADFALLEKWTIETVGQLGLNQKQAPIVEDGILLSGPVELDYSVDNKKNYQINLDLNVSGVKTPPLEQVLPVRVVSKNNLTWPLSNTKSVSEIDIDGKRAIDLDLSINDKNQFLDLAVDMSLHVNPQWQVYLKDLKELETVGVLQTDIDLDAKVKHPFSSILDLNPEKLEKLSTTVRLDTTLIQDQSNPGSLLVLAKPAKISQHLKWSADSTQWQSDFLVPDLVLADIADVKDIHATAQANANSGLKPDQAGIEILVDKGRIKLLSSDSEVSEMDVGHVVTPLSFSSAASWTDKDVDLKKLNLNIGSDLLAVQAFGTASLDGKNAQIETNISSRLRDQLFNKPMVSGAGGFQIPIRLTLLEGKQVALEGEMQFDHLDLSIDDLAIQNLNGSFKIEEELLLENESAEFRYLLDPNPFQRVDFTRIQPYLNAPSLSIDKIVVADKSLGPVLASVMLKQNIFSLQQFDVDLFSGHSAGQFYLDVRPDAWKLGLLSRITHLDPRQLLAKDSKLRKSKLSPINTRTAIEFDIHKRLMEGEIVVSQINRDQLLQLLDVIDPSHEDEQMAQLRKVLRFSHPELVQVNMQRGLMNLKVEVAGLPKAIRVTGLPLTSMIQQFASEALEKIDAIPLQ